VPLAVAVKVSTASKPELTLLMRVEAPPSAEASRVPLALYSSR
jgi:hypothetical protein